MEDVFLNDDLATEMLCKLPVKDIAVNKCVSKGWNRLISSPAFKRFHLKRSKAALGLLFQRYDMFNVYGKPISFIRLGVKCPRVEHSLLDFLPVKVFVMASCDGLLCCRRKGAKFLNSSSLNGGSKNWIYVCNPTSKEWIRIPYGECDAENMALAFYPFGSLSNRSPNFKLVNIKRSSQDPSLYSFVVYTSETRKWMVSEEIFHYNYKIHEDQPIFIDGKVHWLTLNNDVITFEVEKEVSRIVKLPGPRMPGKYRTHRCIGCSDGCIHYVYVHAFGIKVWMLKDYKMQRWMFKHYLPLQDLYDDLKSEENEHLHHFYLRHCKIQLLTFHDDKLFMKVDLRLLSYDFRIRQLKCHGSILKSEIGFCAKTAAVHPYTAPLAAMGVIDEIKNREYSYQCQNCMKRRKLNPDPSGL